MTENSSSFAAFVRETRERRGWSQQQVNDAGGPYRQAQAAIESEQHGPIQDHFLHMYDRAYGWPAGYAIAVAELGEYSENPELGDALRGGDRDAAAQADYRGQPPREVWKTFSGLYEKAEPGMAGHPAYLGFDPTTGKPVYLDCPLLTNVPFEHLHPMILARHASTVIDVNVGGESSLDTVRRYATDEIHECVAQGGLNLYRAGTSQPGVGELIAIDPLSDITTLSEAKFLVEKLRKIRPDVPISTMRAAFTFLAIVAFGEDPIVTMTELARRGGYTTPRVPALMGLAGDSTEHVEFNTRFERFWQEFYDPTKAGPDLARPDHRACDLLAGVLAARDEVLRIDIGSYEGRRHPRYEVARTVRPKSILADTAPPSMLFYDSHVAPELPVAVEHGWAGTTLTFYEAELNSGDGVRPLLAPPPSIGITSADDRDIVAQHKRDKLDTLTNYRGGQEIYGETNYRGGQAIYCESGRARRVWIPGR